MTASKFQVEDLAIFGGTPAFDSEVHVGRPNIGNRVALLERISGLLDRKWLTNDGPQVQKFEKRICQLIGVKHCVAVCNATVGLEILAKAMGLSGEVILPSFTFIATAHALRWHGVTTAFSDVDSTTHNIDPLRVEQLITGRTTGIIGVHLWGRPCGVEALEEIAQRHRLKLLFDAAHAFGCSHNHRMIGNFGNAELFSFHATKILNAFEGGAVVTNDDELAAKIRLMRNFGFSDYDMVTSLGINGKMSEASAAMGLTSLESLDNFIDVNRRNYHLYRQKLARVPGISLSHYQEDEKCNYQYVVIEIDEPVTGVSRDILNDILWAENVLVRRYFYPGCHRMEPYRTDYPQAGLRLPQTERLAKKILCLPTGSAVNSGEISVICELIEFIIKPEKEMKERLFTKPIFRHRLQRSSETASSNQSQFGSST